MRFANLLYESTTNRNISPLRLCEQMNFSPSAVRRSFSHIFRLFGFPKPARTNMRRRSNVPDLSRRSSIFFISGAGRCIRRVILNPALALFIKSRRFGAKGILLLLRIYTDIELCAQRIGNYEIAYKYSAKHISTRQENFGK